MWIKHRRLLFASTSLGLVALVAILVVSARVRREANVPVGLSHPSTKASGREKVLLLKVTKQGFEPAAINVPPGQYSLIVHNSSELRSLELGIDRVGGPRLESARTSLEELKWTTRVELSPGEYRVTEANHPNWESRVTVVP